MIDVNLRQPEQKECVYCGRKNGVLKGKLVHWPNKESAGKTEVIIITGNKIEPFSLWLYTCQWCRGVETKRKQKAN